MKWALSVKAGKKAEELQDQLEQALLSYKLGGKKKSGTLEDKQIAKVNSEVVFHSRAPGAPPARWIRLQLPGCPWEYSPEMQLQKGGEQLVQSLIGSVKLSWIFTFDSLL